MKGKAQVVRTAERYPAMTKVKELQLLGKKHLVPAVTLG